MMPKVILGNMGGTAADNCTGETIIITDDEISNTVPEYSDKVLTQPSENKCKKSNGSLFSSDDMEEMSMDLAVNKVSKQSTESDPKLLVEEVIVIEDDLKESNFENELHLRSKNCDYTGKQSNPLELSSEVKYCNTNAFNELNRVLLVNNNGSTSKCSDDDDVIFVTTYTTSTTTTTAVANSNVNCSATSSSVSSPSPPKIRRKRKKKMAVVPRRNPKRIAQMEKASVDLAMKLSIPKRIFGCRTKSSTEVVRNCRQSCRNTGAILSPPRALESKDWKDWPSEGLHEKPFYNPATKCIQRFDKNMKFVNKVEDNRSDSASRKTVIKNVVLDDRLATITHQSLHSMLGYVADVKQYNRIRQKAKKQYLGDFCKLFSTVMDDNVRDACEVLLDTCKLYSLCNGIAQEDLVQYINSLSLSDLEGINFED